MPMWQNNLAYRCSLIVLEGVFGQPKMCLHLTGGCLMMELEKVAQVIATCAMLHNVALQCNILVVLAGVGLGCYSAVAPSEKVQGAAQYQHGTCR